MKQVMRKVAVSSDAARVIDALAHVRLDDKSASHWLQIPLSKYRRIRQALTVIETIVSEPQREKGMFADAKYKVADWQQLKLDLAA